MQHVIVIYKDLNIPQQILQAKLLQPLADIASNNMESDILQKKTGSLLLQVILNFTENPSEDPYMIEKIASILYTMTNSEVEDLKLMALWAIKINFTRYQNNEFVKGLYIRCRVIENIIPKIIDSNPKIQENAILALSTLV